jgi:hypothetical protein
VFFGRDITLVGVNVMPVLEAAHLPSEILQAEALAVEAAVEGSEEVLGSRQLALLIILSMRRHGLKYPNHVAGCPRVLERGRLLLCLGRWRSRLPLFLFALVRLRRIGRWWDLPLALRRLGIGLPGALG